MDRPTIGLCAALEGARFGPWDVPATLAPHAYVTAVQRAGAVALLVPPDGQLEADPDVVLGRLDGLMLIGGADVDPALYGQTAGPHTAGTAPARDRCEIALIRRALERDLPVLAICRGMQVLNVALGGTLHQHVPDRVGTDEHRRHLGTFAGNAHQVRLTPGSLAARTAGEPGHRVCSHHHQAIDALGAGLIVTGWSDGDDLPEAVELPDRRFALGVQWHPEGDEGSRVIANFVAAARAGG